MKYNVVSRIKGNINKLARTGFFDIVFSSVIAKAFTFVGGIVLVRILSKSDYGIYTDVMNNYGILFILNDFGCCQAMMQYRSENFKNKEKSDSFYITAYKYGMLFTMVASLLILFSPFFFPFKQSSSVNLTQSLFLLPFFTTTFSFIHVNLLVLGKNKKYAAINVIQTVIHYGVLLPVSYFLSLDGAVIANYGISFLVLLFSIVISYRDLKFDWKAKTLSRYEKRDFLKYAFGTQLNNSLSTMLNLFDVFLIGLIIASSESIASYKVASTIPLALVFVPSSIIIYTLPHFARNNKKSDWIKKYYKKLLGLCALVNGAIALVTIFLSPIIIPLIFGTQYSDTVECFVILMIAFFFNGSLHLPSTNIIYTQHRVKVNIVITVISNLTNIVMDILLINGFGSIGAAYSTLIVSVVSALVSCGYMFFYLRRGINIAK